MIFITDNIAIGNSTDALSPQEGITGILNTAFDLDSFGNGAPRYERHKVGLIDGPGNTELQLVSAVLCLMELKRRHDRVLVHCRMGRSRSVVVMAAYLAVRTDATVIQALNYIRSAKSDIEPSPVLIQIAERAEVLLRRFVYEAV